MQLRDSKNKKTIQEVLRQGAKGEFWSILTSAINDDIEHLRKEQDSDSLRGLPADQYKVENEILRLRREHLENLKNLPQSIIEDLENPNIDEPENFDPYSTSKDFENK